MLFTHREALSFCAPELVELSQANYSAAQLESTIAIASELLERLFAKGVVACELKDFAWARGEDVREDWTCSWGDLLLCMGILRTGTALQDYPSWGKLLGYASKVAWSGASLVLTEACASDDFHLKGVMSDELGEGFCGLWLAMHENVRVLTRTRAVVERGKAVLRGSQEPDFVGVDVSGDAVIAEAKGTSNSFSAGQSGPLSHGKKQVESLQLTGLDARLRVVVGAEMGAGARPSRLLVIDPPAMMMPEKPPERGASTTLVVLRVGLAQGALFMRRIDVARYFLEATPGTKPPFERSTFRGVPVVLPGAAQEQKVHLNLAVLMPWAPIAAIAGAHDHAEAERFLIEALAMEVPAFATGDMAPVCNQLFRVVGKDAAEF